MASSKKHLLLVNDGGGYLGIGPACLLTHLDADLKKMGVSHCRSVFDSIRGGGGCSTGGILIIMLMTAIFAPAKILESYISKGDKMFKRRSMWKLWGPKYDSASKHSVFKNFMGGATMQSLKKPTFIPATDGKQARPKMFDHTDTEMLVEVLMATTAAPTFFQFFMIFRRMFLDGGLWGNAPIMETAAGYKKWWNENHDEKISYDDIWILSLGTGGDVENTSIPKSWWTAINWLPYLLKFLTGGNVMASAFVSRETFGNRMLRISPKMPDFAMDELDKGPQIMEIWRKEYYNHRIEILEFIKKATGGE